MQYPKDFTSELRRKPICGVLSVAMIAGTTFANATKAIKDNMLPHQKRHGGKTYVEQRCGALRQLGIGYREIKVEGRQTLRNVIRNYCRPGRTYMITTSQHVITYRDGEVADQAIIDHYEQHPARRCFVRHMIEVLYA